MIIENMKVSGWDIALNAARTTKHLPYLDKEPSDDFKRKMLLSEHSPIRCVQYSFIMRGVPYFVMVHLCRHKFGVEWFVSTSRPDITGSNISRHEMRQDDLVDVMCVCNAQALINISRKRLCNKASKETIQAWYDVVQAVRKVDPIVADFCKPNCVYRNECTEPDTCGYFDFVGA